MMMRMTSALVLVASMLAAPALAQQSMTIGQMEFQNSCAQCHGAGAKGDGPLAQFLKGGAPDLTRLQAANGGVFPVSRVLETISNGSTVAAHGSFDMPAWGMRYRADAPSDLGYMGTKADEAALVQIRLLALVEYLASLQGS